MPGHVPIDADIGRITRAVGWRPTTFRPAAASRGASETAARWIVSNDHGRSAFVKIGATLLTAAWIRTEHRNYGAIHGPFMPALVGFDDDRERPALAIEDLSDAAWPPPWTDSRIAAVLDVLGQVRELTPPPWAGSPGLDFVADWREVERDPRPFLGLGLCSPAWLTASLPDLIAAAEAAVIEGPALVHLDVRSDNICFRDGKAILIDWNHASIANPIIDVAFWLPSLQAEGGPPPEALIDAPELASCAAAYFCARAGLAPIPEAPHVRPLQLAQARTSLPWAARALGLGDPGGSR